MTIPFFRGTDRVDWFTCALLSWCQIQSNSDLAKFLLDGVAPAEDWQFASTDGAIPGWMVHVSAALVVVSIEGTSSSDPFAAQWQGNILDSAQGSNPPFPGGTHNFFAEAAATILDRISPIIAPHFGSKRFLVTGHSLGGACAQLISSAVERFATQGLVCFVLGCPRVGSPTFAASVPYVQRLTTDQDLVTAMPPPLWAASLTYPIPGPPPLAIYFHAGNNQALHSDSSWDASENTPSTTEALDLLVHGTIAPHSSRTYSTWLNNGITPDMLTPGATGYSDPTRLETTFSEFNAPAGTPNGNTQGEGMYKVTSFFSLDNKGFTDTYYTDVADSATRLADLSLYIVARCAVACPKVQWQYSRFSNLAAPRVVDFATPDRLGIAGTGTYMDACAQPDDALLIRGLTTVGTTFRMFLHGYPDSLVVDDVLNYLASPWYAKWLLFVAVMQSGTPRILMQAIDQAGKSDKKEITSVSPTLSRGFTITPAAPFAGAVGDLVYLSGAGHSSVGYNGRKIVTNVGPAAATFTVGGAAPAGTPDLATYMYQDIPLLYAAPQTTLIERYTAHKLGKVYGERPGRLPSVLPLRR